MAGAVAVVKKNVNKTSNFFKDWLLPLIVLGIGFVAGAFLDIFGKIISTIDKGGYIKKIPGIGSVNDPYLMISGFIWLGIATAAWSTWKGNGGKMVGMFCAGVGVHNLLRSLAIKLW